MASFKFFKLGTRPSLFCENLLFCSAIALKKIVFMFFSTVACAVALLGQLIYQTYLVTIKDFSALKDTSKGTQYIGVFLLSICMIVNSVLLVKMLRSNKI